MQVPIKQIPISMEMEMCAIPMTMVMIQKIRRTTVHQFPIRISSILILMEKVISVTRMMMAMVGPYPAGPYGINEGQTLANLNWEGYTNLDGAALSTERPFAPTSMQAVRETGRAYGLVHVSEFY